MLRLASFLRVRCYSLAILHFSTVMPLIFIYQILAAIIQLIDDHLHIFLNTQESLFFVGPFTDGLVIARQTLKILEGGAFNIDRAKKYRDNMGSASLETRSEERRVG